jgi:hypothetical protein
MPKSRNGVSSRIAVAIVLAAVVLVSLVATFEYSRVASLEGQKSSLEASISDYSSQTGLAGINSSLGLYQSWVSHLAKLQDLDPSAALQDDAPNATMVVSGPSEGAGPATGTETYNGTSEICMPINFLFGGSSCLTGFPFSPKSFQFTIESFNSTTVPNGTFEIVANLTFAGVSRTAGNFAGTMSVRYEYAFQDGAWLISQEDWDFTTFNVEYAQGI